jgi:iron-sulfur cluster assembly protein
MIAVSPSAAAMVRRIMAKEGKTGALLRLAVRGGGCNGFAYQMSFEAGPQEGDHRFEFHGLPVLVDPKSLEFLRGITLDYEEGLNSGFRWRNPNAARTCSCGESFDVQ